MCSTGATDGWKSIRRGPSRRRHRRNKRPYDQPDGRGGESRHAIHAHSERPGPLDFQRADRLIAIIYEALRANPAVFEKTVLLVTYDEHGGFYDHVPPPTDAVPPGAGKSAFAGFLHLLYRSVSAKFRFTMLGPRVPAVVISPLVKAGTVDTVVRDHSCVPATLRQLFAHNVDPLPPIERAEKTTEAFTARANAVRPDSSH